MNHAFRDLILARCHLRSMMPSYITYIGTFLVLHLKKLNHLNDHFHFDLMKVDSNIQSHLSLFYVLLYQTGEKSSCFLSHSLKSNAGSLDNLVSNRESSGKLFEPLETINSLDKYAL